LTRSVIPAFDGAGGWRVHGKTGSIWLRDKNGDYDRNRPIGWFVGWAEKGDQQIIFARLDVGNERSERARGLAVRELFLKQLAKLMQP
jgi:beta-lactamase class D